MEESLPARKIIHVDMDAFFAAIEIRDNPELKGRCVAVGGLPESRGVIATANYEARKFGVKSAVSSAMAVRLCPRLIIVHHNMKKYKDASLKIREVFEKFTDVIEPLSLDEAFLDVTGSGLFNGSATLIAKEIRRRIYDRTGLTASAGVAPNKFLAKVASEIKKPNGQFVITPGEVEGFIKTLRVGKIPGVGKVTNLKMKKLGIETCADMQKLSKEELAAHFGTFGKSLYYKCRGMDNREVVTSRERKSLSVERTFAEDLKGMDECREKIDSLYEEFLKRLERHQQKDKKEIKSIHVKLKFSDFTSTTVERGFKSLEKYAFIELLEEGFKRKDLKVRLLGLGVRFADMKKASNQALKADSKQLTFFT